MIFNRINYQDQCLSLYDIGLLHHFIILNNFFLCFLKFSEVQISFLEQVTLHFLNLTYHQIKEIIGKNTIEEITLIFTNKLKIQFCCFL